MEGLPPPASRRSPKKHVAAVAGSLSQSSSKQSIPSIEIDLRDGSGDEERRPRVKRYPREMMQSERSGSASRRKLSAGPPVDYIQRNIDFLKKINSGKKKILKCLH